MNNETNLKTTTMTTSRIKTETTKGYYFEDIDINDELIKRNGGNCLSVYRLENLTFSSNDKKDIVAIMHEVNNVPVSGIIFDENQNIIESWEIV